jgi:hypothetical protein
MHIVGTKGRIKGTIKQLGASWKARAFKKNSVGNFVTASLAIV